ncbi:hypothetical protein MSSAC_3190 [Methanosarcina siciliae C2J]|uniref:Uncharacterized protein n=1 Tax=Methanosarcina siciliae C2J TaxID=1434118 RepID=A0A0E3PQY5_9EURY|nr:hypothetical protein [Methanosarcina siciliae]AKB37780.1 hypothetical protein MSSAC_3190 [Methanosarcina siciliae C2J]
MKKSTLISISVILLVLVLGGLWYYGSGADVKITDMYASPFGADDPGKLNITLQNNGLKPVDIWLEIENAFVDGTGTSYSTSRLVISDNSTGPWDEESVSLQRPIRLVHGNNSVSVWLGYKLPGEYPVKVRVVQNGRLLDEDTYLVNIPLPELHLKLENELERRNTSDVYKVYGYLINYGLSSADKVSTNLTVTNERTGKTVFTSSEFYSVGGQDKSALRAWPGYPYAIVEIAHDKPSGDPYKPIPIVIIGQNGDRFLLNITSRWQDQVTSAELHIPAQEEGR